MVTILITNSPWDGEVGVRIIIYHVNETPQFAHGYVLSWACFPYGNIANGRELNREPVLTVHEALNFNDDYS